MEVTTLNAIITACGTVVAAVVAAILPTILRKRQLKRRTFREREPPRERQSPPQSAPEGRSIPQSLATGIILAVLSGLLFAAHHVIARRLVSTTVHPLSALVVRNLLAGILIVLVGQCSRLFSSEKGVITRVDRDSAAMLLGRSLTGLFNLLALSYLSASATITLFKVNPVFVFLILAFVLRERMAQVSVLNLIIGILTASAGCLIVIEHSMSRDVPEIAGWTLPGIVSALLAGFFWAAFAVFGEKHHMSSLSVPFWNRQTFLGTIYVATAFIPLAIIIPSGIMSSTLRLEFMQLRYSDLGLLAVLAAVSAAAGIVYFEALKRISSLLATVILCLEIVFTMTIERITLDVAIHWHLMLGAVLIVLGAISIGRENERLRIANAA